MQRTHRGVALDTVFDENGTRRGIYKIFNCQSKRSDLRKTSTKMTMPRGVQFLAIKQHKYFYAYLVGERFFTMTFNVFTMTFNILTMTFNIFTMTFNIFMMTFKLKFQCQHFTLTW